LVTFSLPWVLATTNDTERASGDHVFLVWAVHEVSARIVDVIKSADGYIPRLGFAVCKRLRQNGSAIVNGHAFNWWKHTDNHAMHTERRLVCGFQMVRSPIAAG